MKPATSQIAVFAVSCVVFLVAWAVWRTRDVEPEPGAWAEGSCEARCFERDAECEPFAAAYGGYPEATLAEVDRRAMCNGLCYLMRRQATDPENACLAR